MKAHDGFTPLPTFRSGQQIPGGSAKGVLASDGLRGWRHTASGVRVIAFEAPGPMTSANIVVGTLPISDAGHPHTLEHIIFLGSKLHPERGYLDTLANRSLADGTNAYTEVDHTAYQAEGAGFEGLSHLLPVFVDHVLRPRINEAAFMSEVYYTTSECKEAGVVFCEMHGREHTEEDLCHYALMNALFPGNALSLSSGGICEHIRKLTAKDIQQYHDDYYVGHNTSIVVGGNHIDSEQLLDVLRPVLDDIAETTSRAKKTKSIPWELETKLAELPPVTRKQINFPCPDEDIGSVVLAWRGPGPTEVLKVEAVRILLKYLVDRVSSPLRQKFVECESTLSNFAGCDFDTYLATSRISLHFGGISHRDEEESDSEEDEGGNESGKGEEEREDGASEMGDDNEDEETQESMLTSGKFSKMVMDYLQEIYDSGSLPGTIEEILLTIKCEREMFLAGLEEASHELVPNLLIDEVVYGNVSSLQLGSQVRGTLDRLAILETKGEDFWLQLLKDTLIDPPRVELFMTPDSTLAETLADKDEELAEERIKKHGKANLVAIGRRNEEQIQSLSKVEFPAKAFPPQPSAMNIARLPYSVRRTLELEYYSQSVSLDTDFVHTTVFFNSEKLTAMQRLVLPFIPSLLLNSDVELEDGTMLSYSENNKIISGVTVATEMTSNYLGFSSGLAQQSLKMHFTSTPSNTAEAFKYVLRAVFKEKVTLERLTTIAKNLYSDMTEDFRDPSFMLIAVAYMLPCLGKRGNIEDIREFQNQELLNSIARRPLVTKMAEDVDSEMAKKAREHVVVLLNDTLDALRSLSSSDIFVQIGAKQPQKWHDSFKSVWNSYRGQRSGISSELTNGMTEDILPIRRILPTRGSDSEKDIALIVAIPGAENSYFDLRVDANVYPGHQDWGPLMVLSELLCRMEGPLSDVIRKSGLAYGYGLSNQRWKGYIKAHIDETAAPDVAWVAMVDKVKEIRKKLGDKKEGNSLGVDLDTAKSSFLYALNFGRSTPEYVMQGAISDAALGHPSSPLADRTLEESVESVTLDDMADVFDKHITKLFEPGGRRAVVTCGPSKAQAAMDAFAKCKYPIPFKIDVAEKLVPKAIEKAVEAVGR